MDERSPIPSPLAHLPHSGLSKEMLAKAQEKGLTPVDFLLAVQNNPNIDMLRRIDAAKAVAPFIHPKLASLDVSGRLGVSHEDALKELE